MIVGRSSHLPQGIKETLNTHSEIQRHSSIACRIGINVVATGGTMKRYNLIYLGMNGMEITLVIRGFAPQIHTRLRKRIE